MQDSAATGQPALTRRLIAFQGRDLSGLSFWDRPVFPAGLAPEFDPLPEGQGLFALIDGEKRRRLRGTNDLDMLDPVLNATALLGTGTAQDEVGPWLIDLGRSGRARDRFLSDLFSTPEGPGSAVLLRTAAPLDELRAHLRGLIKVRRDPDEPPSLLLRFWDPPTAAVLLDAAMDRPDRVARLCHTRSGLPLAWYAESRPGQMACFVPVGRLPGGRAREPLCLEARDEAALAALAFVALEGEIGRWLGESYPELGDPDPHRRAGIGAHVVALGRGYGFTLKDEFAYLAHMMVHLGGWFVQSGRYPGIETVLLSDGEARHKPLRPAFRAAYDGSHLPALMAARAALLAEPALYGEPPQPTEGVIAGLLTRHLPLAAEHKARILAERARADALHRRAPAELIETVALITLFLGYRFYDDPFLFGEAPGERDWHGLCRRAWQQITERRDGN